MKDIIKIVKSLEGSSLLLKGISQTVQNEAKEQKGWFLSMLLGTLGEWSTRIIKIKWVFNAASSFNYFWNTQILSKWT